MSGGMRIRIYESQAGQAETAPPAPPAPVEDRDVSCRSSGGPMVAGFNQVSQERLKLSRGPKGQGSHKV